MATLDVEEISPESHEDGHLTEEPHRSSTPKGRGRRRRSSQLSIPRQTFDPTAVSRGQGRQESREEAWEEKLADSQEKPLLRTLDYDRTEFYRVYCDKAGEHDRKFIGKYDEDLGNTLIFAGLFSAVTSAFIAQVQPQLQPDSVTTQRPSSASFFTRSTTPPSETRFPPFHNGPAS
ncbi:hypothetical protein BJ322DRAFT_661720 [Thelephora terrestris]|uniref:DUF6535 domain-containing protein n=1 Tax=Thelephora terrestris TaxID=56493 RepID=A0A9P6H2B6_9AGAM|nr:hypothetical protein BJ322DRAFT_661720 [Thelephora terrestris]